MVAVGLNPFTGGLTAGLYDMRATQDADRVAAGATEQEASRHAAADAPGAAAGDRRIREGRVETITPNGQTAMVVLSPERYDFLVHSAERGHISREAIRAPQS